MAGSIYFIIFLALLCVSVTTARLSHNIFSKFLNSDNGDNEGTKWALLVAGADGWDNYGLQADVCHAYQVLIKGGLKSENIIVFMYDDIAFHPRNPFPGVIINRYEGLDVYKGVRVDYGGKNCTADNFLNVLVGFKEGVNGGTGRVLESGIKDRVFIFYSGHGDSGVLGMPDGEIEAQDFVNSLIWLYAHKKYNSMVIYVQACLSGSMFENLLPNYMDIYAVTSANATGYSYGTYCPRYDQGCPVYNVCLGSEFGIAWLEDWESSDTDKRSLMQQYDGVQDRLAKGDPPSNVTLYGDMKLVNDTLSTYMGRSYSSFHQTKDDHKYSSLSRSLIVKGRPCYEGNLDYFRNRINRCQPDSREYVEAKKELSDILAKIKYEDDSFARIGNILLKNKNGSNVKNNNVQYAFNNCFKSLMGIYKKHCGKLSQYGLVHAKDIRNMCDARVTESELTKASFEACSS